jgi:hypothetical protein
MIDIGKKIAIIQNLVGEGSESHIRYAALECRLAIEEICYERLRLAHKYIPIDKIRTWQPPKLLKFLFEEVEPSLLGVKTEHIGRTDRWFEGIKARRL